MLSTVIPCNKRIDSRTETVLIVRYFHCILICLYYASLIILFYYCFSVYIVSFVSFSAACSALDYHGTSRRLFVGLDSGTISVSVFVQH